jgi:hypothetical protein
MPDNLKKSLTDLENEISDASKLGMQMMLDVFAQVNKQLIETQKNIFKPISDRIDEYEKLRNVELQNFKDEQAQLFQTMMDAQSSFFGNSHQIPSRIPTESSTEGKISSVDKTSPADTVELNKTELTDTTVAAKPTEKTPAKRGPKPKLKSAVKDTKPLEKKSSSLTSKKPGPKPKPKPKTSVSKPVNKKTTLKKPEPITKARPFASKTPAKERTPLKKKIAEVEASVDLTLHKNYNLPLSALEIPPMISARINKSGITVIGQFASPTEKEQEIIETKLNSFDLLPTWIQSAKKLLEI